MAKKATNKGGKIGTEDAFTLTVLNVMRKLNITLEELKGPESSHIPSGFSQALAKALNKDGIPTPRGKKWTADSVGAYYERHSRDGAFLFPALEHAIRSEQSEQAEQYAEMQQRPEQPEPEPENVIHAERSEQDESINEESVTHPASDRSEPSEQVQEQLKRSEHNEHSEQAPEQETLTERSEHSEQAEPNDISPEEDAWILGADLHSEPSEHPEPDESSLARSEQVEPSEQFELDEPNDISFSAEDLALDISSCSEASERSEPDEMTDIPEHMRRAFKALAKEVFEEMMTTVPNVQTVMRGAADDLPPEPEKLPASGKGGRRQVREYGKLSATVDSVLFELFRSECEERKLSAGRMLDAILWARYGKPKLSYQREDAEERARNRPRRSATTQLKGSVDE